MLKKKSAIKPLTKKQRQLVENNLGLINSVLKRNKFSFEEYYDIGAIGLCRAAQAYNNPYVKFSAFACKCIQNEILRYKRTQNYKKRWIYKNCDSYNIYINSDSEETKLDFIGKDELFSSFTYQILKTSLTEIENKVLNYLLIGVRQEDIGKIIGVSRQRIGQIRAVIQNKYKKIIL